MVYIFPIFTWSTCNHHIVADELHSLKSTLWKCNALQTWIQKATHR
jgi:hypothetical protein